MPTAFISAETPYTSTTDNKTLSKTLRVIDGP